MKKSIFILLVSLVCATAASGQGEQNIWVFGEQTGINFNTSTITPFNNNQSPETEGSASICNAAGQMLFYTNGFWVWNRDHELMPEFTGGVSGYFSPLFPTIGYPPLMNWNGGHATQGAAIAAMPSHAGHYYVFSLATTGQLFYSVIDMSLNSGKGGIVAGKKGIFLASGLAEKMTVVKGCNNIWLMVRSRTSNQYRAFEINDTGIVTTPVISNCGNLPVAWYRCGVIKFSPDGNKMAASCNDLSNSRGGLEVYDFNPLTGVLTNPVVLDSSSTLGYYYGACFSPDNGKLYASTSSFSYSGTFYPGKVRQFNLSLASTAAIIASNTIVFSDSYYGLNNVGDMKRGVDGKIYFGAGWSPVPAMHSITAPNLAGLSCAPVPNYLLLPLTFYSYRGVPNDVALINPPDTVTSVKQVSVCFRDTMMLTADSGKRYHWENGSTGRQFAVAANGTYWVSYINTDCKYETDTFKVRFIPLPVTSLSGYSCPGSKQGAAWVKPFANDTTTLNYSWKDGNGNMLRQHWSNHGDTLKGMDTGIHYVQITTLSGCDTTLPLVILPLPVPLASFTADSPVCKGVPVSFTNTSASPSLKWYFGDGNYSSQQSPQYSYAQRGNFTASLVVSNIEGCSDTAFKEISVKGLDLTLSSDKDLANKNEVVLLQTSGSEAYTITAWEPAFLFAGQTLLNQSVAMDTTRTFFVTGISAYGCPAKASVQVAVTPVVLMPTAFTPNGDGVNDRFRPISTGYIFVRYFEIYNRYGQKIYTAIGKSALEGWDGTFNGQLQDLGVFYYHINIETKEGATISLKGDVTLIR